jgi:hypothetical protein
MGVEHSTLQAVSSTAYCTQCRSLLATFSLPLTTPYSLLHTPYSLLLAAHSNRRRCLLHRAGPLWEHDTVLLSRGLDSGAKTPLPAALPSKPSVISLCVRQAQERIGLQPIRLMLDLFSTQSSWTTHFLTPLRRTIRCWTPNFVMLARLHFISPNIALQTTAYDQCSRQNCRWSSHYRPAGACAKLPPGRPLARLKRQSIRVLALARRRSPQVPSAPRAGLGAFARRGRRDRPICLRGRSRARWACLFRMGVGRDRASGRHRSSASRQRLTRKPRPSVR